MIFIQLDNQQIYKPPPPAATPSSTFWPPSHPQSSAASTHFQPSMGAAHSEGVKRTITHGAAQKDTSSSSDQAERPLNQGQSLLGIGEITQDIPYSGDADVSDAETEFPSIEELQLPDIIGSLSSVHGNVTGSDKLKLGTSQDGLILLDSDLDNHGRFEDDLCPSNLALAVSSAVKKTRPDPSGRQVAPSDAAIRTTVEQVDDMPLFASRMGNLEAESCFRLESAQEINAISKVDGILASEGNMNKYQQKSTIENGNCVSAKNVDGDDSEPDLQMRRSDDRSGSTSDTDDGNYVNDSSGSDTDRHPPRSKRRRETESTEDSAQANLSNEKDGTFSTNFSDVFSEGIPASSNSRLKNQHINGGGHATDSDIFGSEPQEGRRSKRAKRTENATHISPGNAKEASLAIANSCEVSSLGTGATSSDSPLESHKIPIRGFLTLQTFQSGIMYRLEFSQEQLPFLSKIGQRPDAISSACSGDGDWKGPSSQERTLSRPGRRSTYSDDDDELLIRLKEGDKLRWDEIAEHFSDRTKETLRVHYYNLKKRSQTSKSKKSKRINSTKEGWEIRPSRFSMDLVDPQLRDALPSSVLPATADPIKDTHESIVSIGNKEHTAVQPRCSSDMAEICEVEALLAKSTVRNVVWYLVKWEGFGDDKNTWQERDDISSELIENFEASYEGNFAGVELIKKRERRGKTEYFVKWKGRPEGENSWEKEATISRERIMEFEESRRKNPSI